MTNAKPCSISKFQDLSNDASNASMRDVLSLVVELWTFGSPGGLQILNFSKCWASPPHLAKVGLRQLWDVNSSCWRPPYPLLKRRTSRSLCPRDLPSSGCPRCAHWSSRRRRSGRCGWGNRSIAHRMGLQRFFWDGQGHSVLLDATIGQARGVHGQQRGLREDCSPSRPSRRGG